MDNLPAIRNNLLPGRRSGILSRFFGDDKVLQGIETETTHEIARIKAEGEIVQYQLRAQAEQELFEYQLSKALDVEKHRTELKARNAKVLATVGLDLALDVKLDEFSQSIEDMGLDAIDEVQHQAKARQTGRREKVRYKTNR